MKDPTSPFQDRGGVQRGLSKFCHACQAIPAAGYCNLAGCPNVPAQQTAWGNLANSQRQLDADGCEVGVSHQAIDETLAELKRCYEVIGALLAALTDSVDWIERLCLCCDVDPQHIRAGLSIEGETLASALATFQAALATGGGDGR